MTETLIPININTDTWRQLVDKTNEIISVLANNVVSTSNSTTGVVRIVGDLNADRVFDNSTRVVNSARQIITGTGLSGGGDLSANRTINLNANTVASLLKADTSIQPSDLAGTVALKTKIDVGDINTTGTASASTFLSGTGVWTEAGGDMDRIDYDPRTIKADVFDRANHTGNIDPSVVTGLVQHIDESVNKNRQIISGGGLTGGGDLTADRTISVGAGTGITVNADDVAVKYGTAAGTATQGNDSRVVNAVNRTGDTMTGFLTLNAAPTNNLHASTKKYVDDAISAVISGSGLVPQTRLINSGTGLSGGGDLTVDRTLSVNYGTAAGTATQGNDSRVVNAVNRTGDTMTGALKFGSTYASSNINLAKHLDLYGGIYGFNVTANNLNYISANNHVFRDSAGFESLVFNGSSITYKGYTVWHEGNDGAGSGLDADLLDGQTGTYYTNAANITGTFGPISASGHIHQTNGVFKGSNNQAILGTLGPTDDSGTIYLRPQGYSSNDGQAVLTSAGNFSVTGNITGKRVFASDGWFISGTTNSVIGNSTAGSFAIRPTAYNSSIGQFTVAADGDITASKHVIGTLHYASLGYFRGNTSLAILGTYGPTGNPGTIYLRPNGVDSSVNQTYLDSSGNLYVDGLIISVNSIAALGTYILAASTVSVSTGATIAGSNLRYASVEGVSTTALSGSWRCMGYGLNPNQKTLFYRYA